MLNRMYIRYAFLLILPCFARAEGPACQVEDVFQAFGYKATLESTRVHRYASLNNFESTYFSYQSETDVEKYDLAVIYSTIVGCVAQTSGAAFCITISESANERQHLKTCNWSIDADNNVVSVEP